MTFHREVLLEDDLFPSIQSHPFLDAGAFTNEINDFSLATIFAVRVGFPKFKTALEFSQIIIFQPVLASFDALFSGRVLRLRYKLLMMPFDENVFQKTVFSLILGDVFVLVNHLRWFECFVKPDLNVLFQPPIIERIANFPKSKHCGNLVLIGFNLKSHVLKR